MWNTWFVTLSYQHCGSRHFEACRHFDGTILVSSVSMLGVSKIWFVHKSCLSAAMLVANALYARNTVKSKHFNAIYAVMPDYTITQLTPMCRSKNSQRSSCVHKVKIFSYISCGLAQETVTFFCNVRVTSLTTYEDNFPDGNALTTTNNDDATSHVFPNLVNCQQYYS